MTDLKKVIKNAQESLEILEKVDEPTFWLDFVKLSLSDAIFLLKAQEPRLLSEEDFANADQDGYIPAWVENIAGDQYWSLVQKIDLQCKNYHIWTSRHTDEQREATPWL